MNFLIDCHIGMLRTEGIEIAIFRTLYQNNEILILKSVIFELWKNVLITSTDIYH
jgi:hypothetical protein